MEGRASWVRKVWFSPDGTRVVAKAMAPRVNGSNLNGSKSSKGDDSGGLQGWDVASGAAFRCQTQIQHSKPSALNPQP